MKKIFAMAIVCIMILSGCTSKEQKIENCVNGFLSSYLSMDYDRASSYCTENVAEALKSALDTTNLNGIVADKIKEFTKKVSYTIVEVDTEKEEGKAFVKYNIKSESPAFVFEKNMVLERHDGDWKVVGLSF